MRSVRMHLTRTGVARTRASWQPCSAHVREYIHTPPSAERPINGFAGSWRSEQRWLKMTAKTDSLLARAAAGCGGSLRQ